MSLAPTSVRRVAADVIYLDYNATTPARPEVVAAVVPLLSRPSNPSSAHLPGRAAAAALRTARERIAARVNVRAGDLTFTSGATESNNIAIATAAASTARRRIVTTSVEHKAVLEPLEHLVEQGWTVERLPVGRDGVVDIDVARGTLDDDVALVSVQLANNEVGCLQPVREITEAAHEVGAIVHTDATQALGKVAVDLTDLDVDLASFSSHKIYGPQGAGALYCRRPLSPLPLARGGGQESGRRAGTENVASIVGFGVAMDLAVESIEGYARQAQMQVRLFLTELQRQAPGVEPVVPAQTERLPNTLSLHCQGVDGEALIAQTPGVAFSTGSACTSMVPQPSHVLQAMLHDSRAASECIRISTGWPTTDAEVVDAAAQLGRSLHRIRQLTA